MIMAISSDSEFDSEAEEDITNLYTQLYFGQGHEAGDISINDGSTCKTLHNNASFHEENLNCSGDKRLKETDPINVSEKIIKSKLSTGVLQESRNKPFRQRISSTCSTDSISGKEPLDNLYCNSSLGLIEEEEDEQPSAGNQDLIDKISRINKLVEISDNEAEESRCEVTRKRTCHKISSDRKICSANLSSDEELCLLPAQQKKVEIINIDSEEDKISSKLKSSKKKKRKLKKQEIIYISSGSESSDSDLEINSLEASRVGLNKPLILNINGMNSISKSKIFKSSSNKGFKKSQVIFSKCRPLTKRKPSCPLWTKEMASFYDSDYSDEFLVEEVHQSQNSHPSYWKICPEDQNAFVKKKKRYFQEDRCKRCREWGHTTKDCSRIPHCLFCGSSTHTNIQKCPQNCCLRCGGPYHTYCVKTSFKLVCQECGNFGHESKVCPDLWRRFHCTVSSSTPVTPKKVMNTRTPYCYNCAKKGHYGHQCRTTVGNKYILCSTQIYSYETPRTAIENDVEESCNKNFNSSPSAFFSELNPKSCEIISSTKVLKMSRENLKNVVGSRQIALQEIQNQSGAEVTCFFKGTKENKLLLKGTPKEISSASDIVSMLINKTPKREYKNFSNIVKEKLEAYKKESIQERKKARNLKSNLLEAKENDSSPWPGKVNEGCQENFPAEETDGEFKGVVVHHKRFPVHLPYNKRKAIEAVKSVLRSMSHEEAKKVIRSSIKYFSSPVVDMEVGHGEDFSKRLQLFSKVVHTICQFEHGNKSVKMLRKFVYKMEALKSDRLSPALHEAVSSPYSNIVNPPEKKLSSMLSTARNLLKSKLRNKKFPKCVTNKERPRTDDRMHDTTPKTKRKASKRAKKNVATGISKQKRKIWTEFEIS